MASKNTSQDKDSCLKKDFSFSETTETEATDADAETETISTFLELTPSTFIFSLHLNLEILINHIFSGSFRQSSHSSESRTGIRTWLEGSKSLVYSLILFPFSHTSPFKPCWSHRWRCKDFSVISHFCLLMTSCKTR